MQSLLILMVMVKLDEGTAQVPNIGPSDILRHGTPRSGGPKQLVTKLLSACIHQNSVTEAPPTQMDPPVSSYSANRKIDKLKNPYAESLSTPHA